MKILHLSNKPAYPKIDGGTIAIHVLLEQLSKVGMVHHWSISTHKHPFNSTNYKENAKIKIIEPALVVDTKLRIRSFIKFFLSKKSIHLDRFFSNSNDKRIRKHLSNEHYDVIVFDSVYSALHIETVKSFSNALLAVRTHNVEYKIWEQQALKSTFIKKNILLYLSKSLKRREFELLNQSDQIWAITPEDALIFKKYGVQSEVNYFPLGIHLQNEPIMNISPHFFHLGSLNWKPNQESVEFVLSKLWGRFHVNYPKTHFFIAGSFQYKFKDIDQKSVSFMGYIDDLTTFYRKSGVLIAPILSGSGVRVKLLEAMSYGIPCITTSLGAEGIDPDEAGLMIANSTDEFLSSMKRIIEDETLRNELGKKGFQYIKKHHDWNKGILSIESYLNYGDE